VPSEPARGDPRKDDEDTASRRLLDLVRHPERVADLTTTDSASVLCHIASLLAALSARLGHSAASQRAKSDDRLLTVDEVAQRLSISSQAVYRRASSFPFTVHVGRYLRFSERGLVEYLESRRGR
jgi:predicted DNA-binding transcriptional regulator AlpA